MGNLLGVIDTWEGYQEW